MKKKKVASITVQLHINEIKEYIGVRNSDKRSPSMAFLRMKPTYVLYKPARNGCEGTQKINS